MGNFTVALKCSLLVCYGNVIFLISHLFISNHVEKLKQSWQQFQTADVLEKMTAEKSESAKWSEVIGKQLLVDSHGKAVAGRLGGSGAPIDLIKEGVALRCVARWGGSSCASGSAVCVCSHSFG